MKKLKKEYRYMVNTRCWSSCFDDLQSAKDCAKGIQSDDVAIWVLGEDFCDPIGLYGRDFDGTYEEDEPVLNDKELLEKCKTNQPITDDDIGTFEDSALTLKSWGKDICDTAMACGVNLSDDTETKRKPHICTQEELYKLKVLQKCKEHDLLTIQTHHKLGHDDSNSDLYRIIRERIRWYDKYMYAIKTGNNRLASSPIVGGVNLELVTPMGIMEEEKPNPEKPFESNKKEVKPYDSLLDDEKSERINKCLNKL